MSTCLTRHVGAVLVRDRRCIATGFNGNVPCAKHCVDGGCERCYASKQLEQATYKTYTSGADLANCTCVHGEANAIAQCAKYGIPTQGTICYSTHSPCLECVKLLAVSGVVEVVYIEHYPASYVIPPTLTMRQFT